MHMRICKMFRSSASHLACHLLSLCLARTTPPYHPAGLEHSFRPRTLLAGAAGCGGRGLPVILAVPVTEVGCDVGVLHQVAELPSCALVIGGQEGEHVVLLLAAQEPDKAGDPARGNYVHPFVRGDGRTEEFADAKALVVASDRSVPFASIAASR
jgi:hypothetical protein